MSLHDSGRRLKTANNHTWILARECGHSWLSRIRPKNQEFIQSIPIDVGNRTASSVYCCCSSRGRERDPNSECMSKRVRYQPITSSPYTLQGDRLLKISVRQTSNSPRTGGKNDSNMLDSLQITPSRRSTFQVQRILHIHPVLLTLHRY